MALPELGDLVGRQLREGRFVIDPAENIEFCAAVHVEPAPAGIAHPGWTYAATQRGIGTSIAEVFAMADFTMEEGPMLGASKTVLHEPLRVGTPYVVSGEIVGAERKTGKKTGVFDVVTLREKLSLEGGPTAAEITNTYILPRRKD